MSILLKFIFLVPSIKIFIGLVCVIGPISIIAIITILRNIEKDHPESIRWR